jgi:hypothetical protein
VKIVGEDEFMRESDRIMTIRDASIRTWRYACGEGIPERCADLLPLQYIGRDG